MDITNQHPDEAHERMSEENDSTQSTKNHPGSLIGTYDLDSPERLSKSEDDYKGATNADINNKESETGIGEINDAMEEGVPDKEDVSGPLTK